MSDPFIKCVLYARVSTAEKPSDVTRGSRQDPENQLRELRSYAASQNWVVHEEYVDRITGSVEGKDRPELSKLLKAVQSHRPGFTVVLFWSIDRLGRGGVLQVHQLLDTFTRHGVKYRSLQEPYLDTLGIFGEVVISLLACLAKQERLRMSERVKAGLQNRKARGFKIGRKVKEVDDVAFRKLVASGASLTDLSRVLNISRATAARRLKEKGLVTQGMGELAAIEADKAKE
jgi:DNA invertase Pin-like site-specific DNA recombinase